MHGQAPVERAPRYLLRYWLKLRVIWQMTSNQNALAHRYLDAQELAHTLGISERAVVLRATHRPWLLPPRAEFFERALLRWRLDVVESWIADTKF